MRIVQICYGFLPRQVATNGGELRYWQNLASLVSLGHEVHLLVVGHSQRNEELDPDIEQLAASTHIVPRPIQSVSRLDSWRALISNSVAFDLFLPSTSSEHKEVEDFINRVHPDLIWLDWIGAMRFAPDNYPIIYGHSDFYYKVRAVRYATRNHKLRWAQQMREQNLERAELRLCAKANHVVCVSASESQQLQGRGLSTTYIPIVGPTVAKPIRYNARGRVFLFGTWANTAMRASAQHLRTEVWPLLDPQTNVEWHQVGTPEPQPSVDWDWIKHVFTCHGFVSDLSEVFQIGDVSLIPYTQDTGFRTKFVTASSYGMVNVGYEITFLCAPEFTNRQDCLMATSPQELADLLRTYAGDDNMRRKLGEASRALYERTFSFEAQLPKYAEALAHALKGC